MNKPMLRAALALASALSGACQASDQSAGTPGEQGRVEFTYQRSCFFGCPLEQPLLSGSHEQIELSDAGDVTGLQVTSSDEAIASFTLQRACYCERANSTRRIDIALDASCDDPWHKHCDNRVLVEAREPGDASLILRDDHDAAVDRVQVLVRSADKAEFAGSSNHQLATLPGTSFELAPADSLELAVTFFDDRGRKLLAPDGVTWRSTDPNVATLSAWLIGQGAQLSAGLSVVVEAKSAGTTEVGVSVPGLDADAAHVSVVVQP